MQKLISFVAATMLLFYSSVSHAAIVDIVDAGVGAPASGDAITFTGTGQGTANVVDGNNLGLLDATASVTTTGAPGGTINFAGNSTVSGTVGSNANKLSAINVNGTSGKKVTMQNAVYAMSSTIGAGELELDANSNITSVSVGSGRLTLAVGADLTGDVNFTDDGTINFSNNGGIGLTGNITNSAVGGAGNGNVETNGDTVIDGQVGSSGAGRIGSIDINTWGKTEIMGSAYATDATIGPGTLQLDGGTNDITQVSFSDDGILLLRNGADLTGTITTTAANLGNILITGVGTSVLTGNVGGSGAGQRLNALSVEAGTLRITGATYARWLFIEAGTLQLEGDTNGITEVEFSDDGTLALVNGADLTGKITTTANNRGNISNTGAVTSVITGTVGGSGAGQRLGSIDVEAGTLRITGATYATDATIAAGTLQLEGGTNNISGVSFSDDGTLALVNGADLTGTISTTANNRGNISKTGSGTSVLTGTVGGSGAGQRLGAIDVAAGTMEITGAAYATDTIISGGTLKLDTNSNISTINLNGGTLELGNKTLTGIGTYTQAASTTLKLTITDIQTYGHIESGSATISENSTLQLTVAESAPLTTNSMFTIVTAGDIVNPNISSLTINDDVTDWFFTPGIVSGNLVLTALPTTFVPTTNATSNTTGVGQALDSITSPGSDMSTVMNELNGLKGDPTVYNNAVDSIHSDVDGGVSEGMFNLSGLTSGVYTQHLDSIRSGISTNETGFAFGDQARPKTFWMKVMANYLKQGVRNSINGFDATTSGTMAGIEWLASDDLRVGWGGGWARTDLNNKDNAGGTIADSYQGSLFSSYQPGGSPYYLDTVISVALNRYHGRRNISFGAIDRQAKSSYDGQQFTGLLSGGYSFNVKGGLVLTPLASLEYSHLDLSKYNESGAGDLNLNVREQRYDFLQSGLGIKLSLPLTLGSRNFSPEVHAKWLHEYLRDKVQLTSTFTGGGSSFSTTGPAPDQNSYNIGLGLSLVSMKDWKVIANYDLETKEQFFSHSGSLAVRIGF